MGRKKIFRENLLLKYSQEEIKWMKKNSTYGIKFDENGNIAK
ncbi:MULTISPECIES: hypothetical protein [Clostridium]|uniref:Uncharacterized protein n=1 Tax=Clostridium frigoriphilum TaxID=443253 RepID=A0ABU7UU87_9CLOT|nr:hypothetical protein [Clostridium sp. DSM 17811]